MQKSIHTEVHPSKNSPIPKSTSPHLQTIDTETSRAITGIRFVLMALVVFIHCDIVQKILPDNTAVAVAMPHAARCFIYFFQNTLARCAVPLFFFVSGYILFSKPFIYKTMIAKKCKTLALPYFLWTIIWVFAFPILKSLPFFKQFQETPDLSIFPTHSFSEWMIMFFGKPRFTGPDVLPEVLQFWFIRDLFILFLISPLLKKAAEKAPLGFITFVMLIWIQCSNLNLMVYASQGLCFFTFGLYASKVGFSAYTLTKIKYKELLSLICITTSADIILFSFGKNYTIVHLANILLYSISLLKLSVRYQKNEKVFSILSYLAGFSFWIYAFHKPVTETIIQRVFNKLIVTDGWMNITELFAVSIITVAVSLFAGILVKKCTPKVFALLTGTR